MLNLLCVILEGLGTKLLTWRAEGRNFGNWQGNQLKAEVDRLAHSYLLGKLNQSWPDIPVISEEDTAGQVLCRPNLYWLIDPVDGTASFCNGFDGFVTQVALIQNAQPILGIVHAPALGKTYTATIDGHASLNGLPIAANQWDGERKLILTDNYPNPRGIASDIYNGINCGGYIESGSIGLKICLVAQGKADIFIKDVSIRDWDVAPGHLILTKANGQLETLTGQPFLYDGSYEKSEGLVATCCESLTEKVNAWYRSRNP